MSSLTKIVLAGLGVAIASSLHAPISAQTAPQSDQKASNADALGGPLTPSNPTLFQAQDGQDSQTIKMQEQDKEKAEQILNAPLTWQSEHLDDQRRSEAGFSIINVDFN